MDQYNIFNFIKKTRSPFIAVEISIDDNNKKKYDGLIAGYQKFTFEESVKHYEKVKHKYNYNQILFKVPNDIIIIDTDAEKTYNYIKKTLKNNDYYNKDNIFKSYTGLINNLNYKRHFIFKYEPNINGFKGVKHFQNLDIFNDSWGVAEWLDSNIDYDNLKVIHNEIIDHFINKYGDKSKINNIKEKEQDINIEQNNNKIISCLESLKYDRFKYNDWLNIGMIIKNETNDINIWKNWSKNYDKYDEQEIIKKWKSFNSNINNKLKIGTLINMMKEDNNIVSNKTINNNYSIFNTKLDTDIISKHFMERCGDRWICQDEKIYYYTGVYWKYTSKTDTTYLSLFIRDIYRPILFDEYTKYESIQLQNQDEDTIKKLKTIKDFLFRICNNETRKYFINDIVDRIRNDDIKFDENLYLFAFNNKIFDLKENKFIEPKLEYYISLTCGYDYIERNEEQNKIELHKIIDTIFPDEEIKTLYMTLLSTGLDGQILEKFVLANGSGGNGKGLINELVTKTLGKYAYILPSEILLKPLKTGPNPEVANLHNKRLVIAREPDSNMNFNCATIKEITGGDELNARQLYSKDTQTLLRLSLILECNNKPKLNESTDALGRRILDIPFKNKFVDKDIYDELDEDEKKTTFETNYYYKTPEFKQQYKQTLFLILCDYYKILYDNNKDVIDDDNIKKKNRTYHIPFEIKQRNNEYLKSSDDLYNWLEDNYEHTDNKKDIIKLKDIYELYKRSDYFTNLNKIKKRQESYKNFIMKLETNMFLKKYITTDKSNVNILTNYKIIYNDKYNNNVNLNDDTD